MLQVENSAIILTGAGALNKLLGREVYTSNAQVGHATYAQLVWTLMEYILKYNSSAASRSCTTTASRTRPRGTTLTASSACSGNTLTYDVHILGTPKNFTQPPLQSLRSLGMFYVRGIYTGALGPIMNSRNLPY